MSHIAASGGAVVSTKLPQAGGLAGLVIATGRISGRTSGVVVHLLVSLGLFGLFLVSVVDSSFVPLPVPGMTDMMIVGFAAQHTNPILLVLVATVGSALGGYLSYQVGQAGGMAFIEKRTPPKTFNRVCGWMEDHAILAIALPAILPPPMPLSPFVLAAGALRMSQRKFMVTFTTSRMARHAIAAWLGIAYGRQVLRFWHHFSERWGTTFLIVVWGGIALSVGYAMWQLWKTRNSVGMHPQEDPQRPTTA
ncbi:membrane-associated protein [Granulicella sp. WH15]|uniref:YqaA family protein n=1 Tax=Granulicella sp. WH15 TaxID=2602070 RepID=UPI0013672A6E|nr:VTT domain-containing protein [Granulicella sp. WH15]QHN05293.1 membrane-associated protein [Granulicella sp. WH15]